MSMQTLKEHHLLRAQTIVTPGEHPYIHINNKKLVNFTSNDYLGISQHPDVIKAFITGANSFGLGSGSSAQVSGFSSVHHELEVQMADYLGRERALLFNSGYHANLGVISSLAGRGHTIITDKQCHASIIDAVVLSRAKHYRFKHQDLLHAEELLQQLSPSLLITESVFSMSGKITDVNSLANLAKKYDSLFIVDDAHGVGIIDSLPHHNIDCLVTPLGKSFGSMGAVVSGKNDLIEFIFQAARTHRYSTALPPAICMATLAGLKVIRMEQWRREKLVSLITIFNKTTAQLSLPLISDDITPIRCIKTKNINNAIDLQQQLLQLGFFTACIRPPTVPANSSLIRISLNYSHSETQIKQLLGHIKAHYND